LIVLDSSFLIAFHNGRDAHHPEAAAAMEQFLAGHWGGGLLLEYVFLEVVTVLLVRRDRSTAARTGRILLEAHELEFVPCSDFFPETAEKFSRQTVTNLSFADSAIALVARHRAEGQILTFDAEFLKVRGLHVFPRRRAV
jgi:predicted nucleic acid-binding protein